MDRKSSVTVPKTESNRITTVESKEADGWIIDGEFVKSQGVGWFITGCMLAGDMAGAAMITLPTAAQQTGFYAGLALILVIVFIGGLTADFLGKSWCIILRHWPEYRSNCRKPYAAIAVNSMGPVASWITSICLNISNFGICVVFLLIIAKNVHDFLRAVMDLPPSACIITLALFFVVLPLTFMKSPEDFWGAIVASMIATAIAVVLIVVGSSLDYKVCSEHREDAEFRILNSFVAFGTIAFAFFAASMKKPKDFTKSLFLGFSLVTTFYLTVTVFGSLTYGNSLRDSVINSIQTQWIQKTVNLLIALHCLLATLIMINPVNQEAEEIFECPHEFGWQRVAIRSGVLALITLLAESVPNFGPVLNLLGASSFTLSSLILPCFFYLYLSARVKKMEEFNKDEGPVGFIEMLHYNNLALVTLCGVIIVVGAAGFSAGSFSALRELTTTRFQPPCYVQWFLRQSSEPKLTTSTICCGTFENISVAQNSANFCNSPNLDFYGSSRQ